MIHQFGVHESREMIRRALALSVLVVMSWPARVFAHYHVVDSPEEHMFSWGSGGELAFQLGGVALAAFALIGVVLALDGVKRIIPIRYAESARAAKAQIFLAALIMLLYAAGIATIPYSPPPSIMLGALTTCLIWCLVAAGLVFGIHLVGSFAYEETPMRRMRLASSASLCVLLLCLIGFGLMYEVLSEMSWVQTATRGVGRTVMY